jgi:hypothetical protein
MGALQEFIPLAIDQCLQSSRREAEFGSGDKHYFWTRSICLEKLKALLSMWSSIMKDYFFTIKSFEKLHIAHNIQKCRETFETVV